MRQGTTSGWVRAAAVGLLAAGLAGCATTGSKPAAGGAAPAAGTTLYARLGGKKAIAAVVDDMVNRVSRDARIKQHFATTDLKHLKKELTDQICEATGGPCKYKGKDMKTVHEGLGITDADFGALVEDLIAAMKGLSVPQKEQDDLLALLAPMKKDIVEK